LSSPFVELTFIRDQRLEFVEAPALQPPEVTVDLNDMANWRREMDEAANTALPEGDDDDF
jgi:GTP-binding nuclear protein Ran